MNFTDLALIQPLLQALSAQGHETPTPIQTQAIPLVLNGRDVLACAQTGTGKTAAFALPILQRLMRASRPAQASREARPRREVRALVLTPTRELASQIGQSFADYGSALPLRCAVVFGGVRQHSQVRALREGADILVATPGRLIDLMHQKHVHFRGLEILVLDEADRMLDMGFIRDVRRIIAALPRKRQTLFFSATMPEEIRQLSRQILTDPARIEVTPVASTVDTVTQAIYLIQKKQKTALLIHLIKTLSVDRALVFTRTKRDANRVADSLNRSDIKAEAIHGNKSQNAREQALTSLKHGRCRVLVATDIAARGIDIDRLTHVFNHDIPNVPESYVHRIGRTARAGASGTALSFCASEERGFVTDIERLIRQRLPILPVPEGIPAEAPKWNRADRRALVAPVAGTTALPVPSHSYHNPPPSPNNRRQRRQQARAVQHAQ
ncbi:MAG: DEAD/DEAH box helicase [Bdellovibrionales bacterium RIFOXYD1_FULL_55_31]|nr:MAG: DEAD/DEAH box helicase [Bdellovibrionales bacterium RIFOXYD1_FULL_55_31]